MHKQLQPHMNVMITKIFVLFLMAQRHRVGAWTKEENDASMHVMFSCVD